MDRRRPFRIFLASIRRRHVPSLCSQEAKEVFRATKAQPLARFAEAHSALECCLAIFDNLGRRGWASSAQTALGSVTLYLGQYEKAHAHADTGLVLAQEKGLRFSIGQYLLEESVPVYRETGQPDDLASATAISAFAACGLGQWAQVDESLSTALQVAADFQYAFPIV